MLVSELGLVCSVGEPGVDGAISVPVVAQDELQAQSNTAHLGL